MSSLTIVSVTGTTTIPAGQAEVVYMVDASGGGFTITLPDAVGDDGDHFYVKRIDTVTTNPVTITTQSSQKIDGAGSVSLTRYKCYHFVCYNSNWFLLD
jgi:hypothetical protein